MCDLVSPGRERVTLARAVRTERLSVGGLCDSNMRIPVEFRGELVLHKIEEYLSFRRVESLLLKGKSR